MSKAIEYLKSHGLTESFARSQGLTWNDNNLHIPVKDENGNDSFIKSRNLNYKEGSNDPKYRNSSGSHATLFNFHAVKNTPNIVLCEGEVDCLKLTQEGIPAVSSSGGAGTFKKQWAEYFNETDVLICYDNDASGKSGSKKVLELLPHAREINLPEGIKDICDYFVAGNSKEDFLGLMGSAESPEEADPDEIYRKMLTINLKDLYSIKYDPEDFIIDKFLPVSGMTMISGDSGVGKSWLALEVIKAITKNEPFLEQFEVKYPYVPILLIDKENGLRRIQLRSKGMGIPNSEDIHVIKTPHQFVLTDEELLEDISRLIIEKDIKVIVIDSFIDILVGSENDSSETSLVFNALRSISTEVCWLLLHHESKPVPGFHRSTGNRARGSSNIKAQVDYLFSAQRTKELKVINIEQGKARDYEAINKFAVEFVGDDLGTMTGFRYIGEVQDEITKVEEAGDFLLEFLEDNPKSLIKSINKEGAPRGITKASLKRARDMLLEKQLIESIPDPTNRRRKLFSKLEVSEE